MKYIFEYINSKYSPNLNQNYFLSLLLSVIHPNDKAVAGVNANDPSNTSTASVSSNTDFEKVSSKV